MTMTIQQLQRYPMGEKGLKVRYTGIINSKELSEHNKKEPKDLFSPEYNEWVKSAPLEKIGKKIAPIKEIIHFKKYSIIRAGIFRRGLKNLPIGYFTPILYPPSCLTKEIEVYGEKFVPIDEIRNETSAAHFKDIQRYIYDEDEWIFLPYWIIQLLQSWFINYQGIEAINPFGLPENPYK